MDVASTLILLITLGIFFVPIWYFNALPKRREAQIRALFNDAASKQGINPTEVDVWNNRYALGIDPTASWLFYIRKTAEQVDKFLIELPKVESCRVVPQRRNVALDGGSTTVTDRLALVVTFRNRQMPDLELEIYNSTNGGTLGQENALAEKWASMVKKHLKP